MFRKTLCDKCNIDGECSCQSSQNGVNNCGMEEVVSYNKHYQHKLRSGTLTDGSLKEFYGG